MRRLIMALAAAGLAIAAAGSGGDAMRLRFHAETASGDVVASQGPDDAFNPASVVKVGTSLWALERLGPDYRYPTVVGYRGDWRLEEGTVVGQLVVAAFGDPDLQAENLFLIAAELNRMGVRRVVGGLEVSGPLHVGWERGVEGRTPDPEQRALEMAERFRAALDPQRWSRSTRAAWQGMCRRRDLEATSPPRVVVEGPVSLVSDWDAAPLVLHHSNPLVDLLKRFNVYSNNDIIRVAEGLGGVQGLTVFLCERLGVAPGALELETASGEHRNRITARMGVRLVAEMATATRGAGLAPGDVMVVLGCDPGAARHMFPRLMDPPFRGAAIVKTGTLTNTDGGVATLAGLYGLPGGGEVRFCVAAPRAGGRLQYWRSVEQRWLMDLMQRTGFVSGAPCGLELPMSDTFALVSSLIPVDPAGEALAERLCRHGGSAVTAVDHAPVSQPSRPSTTIKAS